MSDTNRPLWQVMHDAFLSVNLSGGGGHKGFAAELRAIANWLVPEGDPDADCIVPDHGRYLYELLIAEADRAEAGNDDLSR